MKEIELSGGIVTKEIAGADIVLVGDQPRDEDIQSMSKTSTPRTDLELLYKLMEMEESLLVIVGTPSKVSLADKPNKQPLAHVIPTRQNYKMSCTSTLCPKRYPLSQKNIRVVFVCRHHH